MKDGRLSGRDWDLGIDDVAYIIECMAADTEVTRRVRELGQNAKFLVGKNGSSHQFGAVFIRAYGAWASHLKRQRCISDGSVSDAGM